MKAQNKTPNASETMILKLTLRHTGSERVVALPPSTPVETLYHVALGVFNFFGGHLGKITRKDGWTSTVLPDFGGFDDFGEDEDEAVWETPVGEFFPVRGTQATIDYDFGDGWKIIVTRMADKAQAAPFVCVKTQGPNAVEDCGGPGGMAMLYEDLSRWIDASKKEREDFDEDSLDWAFELDSLTEQDAHNLIAGPSTEEVSEILARFAQD